MSQGGFAPLNPLANSCRHWTTLLIRTPPKFTARTFFIAPLGTFPQIGHDPLPLPHEEADPLPLPTPRFLFQNTIINSWNGFGSKKCFSDTMTSTFDKIGGVSNSARAYSGLQGTWTTRCELSYTGTKPRANSDTEIYFKQFQRVFTLCRTTRDFPTASQGTYCWKMLVSKYPKNQLKTSKTDPGNPYAVRHRLYVIYQFQNTLGISWKPRNWTENLNTVSNTLRMSWNAWNRETGIPCSPTQTGGDFLFSKYADNQLKTEFLSKNDLTKWYHYQKHKLEFDVEHWWTGTGGPALVDRHWMCRWWVASYFERALGRSVL